MTALDRFRERLLDDAALQAELLAVPDEDAFVALVVARSGLTADDVRAAMRATRRAWLERWI